MSEAATTGIEPGDERSRRVRRPTTALSLAMAFVVATVVRGSDVFLYDALAYWDGARFVVGASGDSPPGYFDFRGILTPFVYAPAALATHIVGDGRAGVAVLLQNAVVLASLAAYGLPAILRRLVPVTTSTRVVAAVALWVVTAGFAPYPLIDVYAALACLGGATLVASGDSARIVAGGALLGVAFNLRPAYLATSVLLLVAGGWFHRRRSGFAVAGAAGALVPQFVFNAIRFGIWTPLAVKADDLVAVQTRAASFTVRYDTVLGDASPRQFHCSTAMAGRVGGEAPEGLGELAWTLLSNVPASLLFVVEKVAAALYWPVASPYFEREGSVLDGPFALLIITLTVVGAAMVTHRWSRVRHDADSPESARLSASLAVMAIGGVITLMTAATEARFALSLLLVAVVGAGMVPTASPRRFVDVDRRWSIGVVALVAVIVVFARLGLAVPAPPGRVTPELCAGL